MKRTGLVEPLTNDLLTVFAPTNEAFEALPPELVSAVMADTALLTDILWYHAVPNEEVFLDYTREEYIRFASRTDIEETEVEAAEESDRGGLPPREPEDGESGVLRSEP